MGEEVKLFNTSPSPFGLRVVWALKLKGIRYESIEEDLSNKSPLLLQYNPIYKKVPVLVHDGKPVVESLIILEYIEETWQQSPLLPAHPYQRAMAHFWAKFGDDKVLPSIWYVFIKKGKEQEDAIPEALENLKILEEELRGKKFFGGEKIGFVDLAFGWLANTLSVLEEVVGLKLIDEMKFPLLAGWMIEFSDSPVIKESWPPRDVLISLYSAYLKN
ncbi:glutathione s-transferase, putative [Ricinus communis]|uniref:glutathione transferase n=1 Tax=Ricinus communis TaxID=3988 RepID=B9SDC8_RICCO|nr:glutathione s-transferase, putative [Ricinus communis]|eukprot:XP_002523997.1 probable glutathione S-transferase [Ricinus communis]